MVSNLGVKFDVSLLSVCQQNPPHQGQAGQEAEAEPADPAVDPDEDRQHHPLQLQAPPLEEDQAQALSSTRTSAILSPRLAQVATFAKCVEK